MNKRFEFSIVAKFKDMASRGLKRLGKTAKASLFGSRGIMGSFGLGGLAHAQQFLDAQVGAAFGRIQTLELRVKRLGTSKSSIGR